ncbi:cytosolic phospholipase A2 zeta [Metarhizium album ARSEF 1941]|uniref:Lysophospholipase n=1 Tax=Metarhizium album (strain ARSEF 1941) TaxID=1081103 RepID=A0A0B2WYG9_METAS|nr:cytosolic phospholipase A2 zeta [Metarhizium album ARSEF 1941]KHN97895.1 cytosolic phospholipase A2 zeta [Metarhizium album ARSEF 1941]
MKRISSLTKGLPALSPLRGTGFRPVNPPLPRKLQHGFFARSKRTATIGASLPVTIVAGTLFIWWLYPSDEFAKLSPPRRSRRRPYYDEQEVDDEQGELDEYDDPPETAWDSFARRIENIAIVTETEWSAFSEKVADMILPDWSKLVPGYLRKLQRELSMAPGSLADEIWEDAHDPAINPEIAYSAQVRVSSQLCDDEKEFLARRKRVIKVALAKYLGLDEHDIHPDDIPTIAMCGSGGGLRALVAGTGSLIASDEDGLFDCVTYTAGVSGSCWLQTLLNSSISGGNLQMLLEHLKNRTSVHIAYPPVAFQSLLSMPTSKYLLSGLVEKLRGDPKAHFGLVDVYGLLLGARFLVPKGELSVNEKDFKLSNQRDAIKFGDRPLPIYTVVRHEIPQTEESNRGPTEKEKKRAKEESWFQWYEITPYEFFCEEFGAGIPTWAMGRKFNNGRDVPPETGFHLPEIRVPLLMGVFGSAFCATLSHYYKEIKPLVLSISGLSGVDQFVSGRDDDLSKVHPIDPATVPNFAYQMHGKLPDITPKSIYEKEYIQLMDAGMSNNLPIYPLLRPGRHVDILIAFDASADIKTDNWLSVADGYARQRGVKGWPLGIGWPKAGESVKETAMQLADAEASSYQEAAQHVKQAKQDQESLRQAAGCVAKDAQTDDEEEAKYRPGSEEAGDLGYCTVWVGTTQERSPHPPPPAKAIDDTNKWQLTEPDAGLAVVYVPFLANKKGPDISPGTTNFLSTWNFVYTPEQIDSVVELARANYNEGRNQIRSTVRAVYERKKLLREYAEKKRVQGLEILSS